MPEDILKDEKLKEKARREDAKKREVDYHAQYAKPKKVQTYEKIIHTSNGIKTKTIERKTYANGVVKETLVKITKDQGMGQQQRVF